MLMMTAKVNKKKIIFALAAIAALILAAVLLFGGDSTATSAPAAIRSNDDRVRFLESFGWQVVTSPAETCQVHIPTAGSEVFDRYNTLQKTMGYDLTQYAGKNVMRYVYKIKNYPGATEPVYATILIANNQVIGGDITDTAATGTISGFQMNSN